VRVPRVALGVTLLLRASCAHPPAPASPSLTPSQIEEPVTATIEAAFLADCHGKAADSLWDAEAIVVADGAIRDAPPRFAGVGPGGQVAITTSRLDLRQSVAWVFLEYRWSELNAGLVREGRATVLLTPAKAGRWTILHAHSSTTGVRGQGSGSGVEVRSGHPAPDP
jgi:hypothetical protein